MLEKFAHAYKENLRRARSAKRENPEYHAALVVLGMFFNDSFFCNRGGEVVHVMAINSVCGGAAQGEDPVQEMFSSHFRSELARIMDGVKGVI